jgi:hypothetical protein
VKRLLPLLILAAGLSACSGEPAAPRSATLDLTLSSPFADDGALWFTVTGGRVDSVTSGGYTLYSSRPDPNTLEVIVTGQLGSGTLAQVHIPDEGLVSQYSVKVKQAAARSSYAQRDPEAYRVTLAP